MARKNVNSRNLKSPSITIIGEGLTEQYYFDHIRSIYQYRYTIKPYFFGTTSLKEMDSKIKEVVENGGIAICVFDTDVSERNDAEKKKLIALRKKYGNKKNVILCDSLPSIEYWFLIHFLNTNRYFQNSKTVENELQKFIKQYEKKKDFLEKKRWVEELCSNNKLNTAIDRSKNFGMEGLSYSNMYKAFELFQKTFKENPS